MQNTFANNKRIAKNTLFLYFRMLFLMAISLYTSRVVLDKLGVTDFGIYNVVSGIVVMLGFLSGCMSNSVQRFLSFEMGRNNLERVNRVFNVSLLAHGGIALFVFVVMECGGLWYLNTHMNVPPERMDAANWVFQCSLLTTVFTIMQVPYNAIIVSKERMGIYAYISILEAVLKLLVVYVLSVVSFDRLKLYGILVMSVTIGILMIYRVYCSKKFVEAKFRIIKDWKLLRELISFSGWNMLSEIAWTFTGPGVNLILNSFFGPAINAARGLAEHVNGAVSRFVSNFQTAVNPQLIKMYAANEWEEMKNLLFRSTRFSFYLMYALSLPLILRMDYVLHIWLKEVPEYTTIFCQLTLACSLVSVLSTMLPKIAWASGNIRNYQIVVSLVLFLNFPLSYVVLKLGASPYATSIVGIGVQFALIFARFFLVCKMIDMPALQYVRSVLRPVLKVCAVSIILPVWCHVLMGNDFIDFVFVALVSILSACLSSFYIGMTSNERIYVKDVVNKLANKMIKRN